MEESDYIVHVPDEIKTKEKDAEQYIVWDKLKKTNLCGLFCVARLSGIPINVALENLKTLSPSIYRVNVTENKPVGISVMLTLAKLYGLDSVELGKMFDDKLVGRFYSSRGFINALEKGWRAILGVKIGYDGKLNSGTIGHWIVLEDIEPIRNGDGIVTIYNPFSNRKQKYSYTELIKSMTSFGGYVGLWVKPKESDMASVINQFCEQRGINDKMKDAFISYVRSMSAANYMMRKDGDTVKLIVEKMNEEQVIEAWNMFIADFKNILPKQ